MPTGPDDLRRLNWALAAYAGALSAVIRAPTIEEVMAQVCQTIVEPGAYVLAYVGMVEDLPGRPVREVARAGPASAYADGLELSASEDLASGQGPTGQAIRTGEPLIMRDALSEPIFAPWRQRGRLHGIRSSVTVPFGNDGRVEGVLLVYAAEPEAFGAAEMEVFQRLGEQLAFALSLDARRRRLAEAEAAHRAAEATVRRERDFSEALIRSLPGVLYMYDEAGRFLRWNQNFERVTGRTAEEIADMRPTDFFTGEGRERIAAAVAEVFATGEAHVEADFAAKDGHMAPYYFTGVAMEMDGRRCLVGIGIDVTEQKRLEAERLASEARYRTLFDYAPDGILIADARSRYLDANPSICRMLGYARAELIGLGAEDIVVEAEASHVSTALDQIQATADYHREWLLRRKDGSVFPAEVVATLMPDGDILAMVRDITDRKAAEARQRQVEGALRDTQAELARFGRVSTLGEFAATIAHEVNQPLAAIITTSDAAMRWLAKDPPNLDQVRTALSRVTRDSRRAHEVIKRTRMLLSRGDPEYVDVDLNDAIEEIMLVTRREQEAVGVTLRLDLRPGLPPVRGNRTELQQVTLNLVLNGIDAMRTVSGRERVLSLSTVLDEDGMVRVAVQDSGIGFDAETAERLFQHFFTTKTGGTGLGLAIARSLAEAHGGRLWAEPGVPYGALFQFTVPVAGG